MITIARLISIYGDWKLNQYSIIFNVSPHRQRIARTKLVYRLLIEIFAVGLILNSICFTQIDYSLKILSKIFPLLNSIRAFVIFQWNVLQANFLNNSNNNRNACCFAGMQNLSISCSLVCLIILGTAVLIGFFGLCRHQISAVLVTGVMYLLAGEFL